MSLARLLLALIFLLAPQAAFAHPPVFGVGGFAGGLLHPFFVLPHAMAIIVLGLLIAQHPRHWFAALAFVAGLAAGSLAIARAYVWDFSNESVLGLAAVTGLLTAFARPLPQSSCAILAAVTGFAIALDSPPQVISISEATLIQLGTCLAASIYLAAIIAIASSLKRDWHRIGMRIIGSWTAASAILVLALRFVR